MSGIVGLLWRGSERELRSAFAGDGLGGDGAELATVVGEEGHRFVGGQGVPSDVDAEACGVRVGDNRVDRELCRRGPGRARDVEAQGSEHLLAELKVFAAGVARGVISALRAEAVFIVDLRAEMAQGLVVLVHREQSPAAAWR